MLKGSVWSLKKVFGDRFGVLAFQFTQMNANLEISQCMGFQVLAKGMIQGRHCNSLHEDNVWWWAYSCHNKMHTNEHTHTYVCVCVAFLSDWLRVWSKENLQIL